MILGVRVVIVTLKVSGESSLGKSWGWEEVVGIMAGLGSSLSDHIKEKEPKMKRCTCQQWCIRVLICCGAGCLVIGQG